MDNLEAINRAVHFFHQRHGVHPVFYMMTGDMNRAFRFVVYEDLAKQVIKWEARGASPEDAINKLDEIASRESQ